MAKKIYEKDAFYSLLRNYVDITIKRSYTKVEVYGLENMPTDGPVIIAPNHCNTLMDPLVVLRARKEPTLFGARADIFNKKLVARILTFLKMVPMVRMRDGLRNVAKNRDSFDQIVETLEHDVKYCMFCEGRHRPMHSLLPVSKGIVRIALAANEKFGDRKPVYILPSGIEYGDYFRYRSTCLLQHGKPINVTEFVKAHADSNEADIYRELMALIHDEIAKLITYIPDDENYTAKWTLTRIWASREGNLLARFQSNKAAAAKAETADEQTLAEAAAFEEARKNAKISYKSLGKDKPGLRVLGKCLGALLFLPFFVYASIAASPIWAPALKITSGMKDKAFRNTGRYGMLLGVYPLLVIIYALLFFLLLDWWIALPMYLLALVSHSIYYSGIEFFRVLASDIRLLGRKDISSKYQTLKTL